MSKEKKKEILTKNVRKQYTPEFKDQTLELAKRDGITKVAKDLGLSEAMLYSWRAKKARVGQAFEIQKLQQAEIAHLKREIAMIMR